MTALTRPDPHHPTSTLAEEVLDQLDRWRHFPNYALERRADIFFARWLPDVLGAVTGKRVNRIMVPEFPLFAASSPESGEERTVKYVDYLAVSEDLRDAWLIELKTDIDSVDTDQLAAMRACVGRWGAVLEALCVTMRQYGDSRRDRKYHHLAHRLGELGLVEVPVGIERFLYGERRTGLTESLKQLHGTGSAPELHIAYVLPCLDQRIRAEETPITFERFAAELNQLGADAVLFARYVLRWIEEPAARPPTDASSRG